MTPLFQDEFAGGPPAKRSLQYVLGKREKGSPVVGTYCTYAPIELVRAMGGVPAMLCAFAQGPIEAAEAVLPRNLCALIKSSYGFIKTDTCPFFTVSEAVIGETTCDGKKKMFELIADKRPLHVMDLPQLPDEPEAAPNWVAMVVRLKSFLEKTFSRSITDQAVEEAIADTNKRNALVRRFLAYNARRPAVLSWSEIYDVTWLAASASGADLETMMEGVCARLDERIKSGAVIGDAKSPRVLITGCPVGGDATKAFKTIEAAGGVIVAIDNCTGSKLYAEDIDAKSGDPLAALARRYLKIPCSCMTPNTGRLTELDRMIAEFKPDIVVDVVLQACHGYNIESVKVEEHVKKNHGLPFLKIETDYSTADVEQIRTRVEAALEGTRKK